MHGNDHISGGPDPIPGLPETPAESLRIFCEQTNLPATADNAYHIYPLDLTLAGTTPDGRDLGNGTPFIASAVFDYDQVNAAVLLKATGAYIWNIRFWGANWVADPLTWDVAVGWGIGPPVSDYPGDDVIGLLDADSAADTLPAPSGTTDYQPRIAYNVDQLWLAPIPNYGEPAPFQVFYKHNGPVGSGELSACEFNITYVPAAWANPEGA